MRQRVRRAGRRRGRRRRRRRESSGPGSSRQVPTSYGRTAWRWAERVERIKGALTAAGIPFETKNLSAMAAAFEDYSTDPLYPDPSMRGNVMGISPQQGTTQAFFQQFHLALINSEYGAYVCRSALEPPSPA